MNSMRNIIIAVVALAVLGGAVALAMNNDDSSTVNSESTNQPATDVMEKKDDDVMEKHSDSMDTMEKSEDGAMMKKVDTYITLAVYEADKSAYSDSTNVLFFHASWCSICEGIEKEINADPSRIPEGTTFIKTDFDSETDLRKKYGVNNQYTFVQIDNDGNQIAKWSATSLDKAIAGINS